MIGKTSKIAKIFGLLASAALLAGLWLSAVAGSAGQFLGVPVLDRQQWDRLYESCRETAPFDASTLRWQGVDVPYDAAGGTLLLSQDVSHSRWEGSLSAADGDIQVYFLENPDMGKKKYCIWENISFQLAVVKDGIWMQVNVLFSGVPVIRIQGQADDSVSSFLLFDPGKQNGKGAVVSSSCRFHKRGNSSMVASDPSLRVTLIKEDGSQNKVNLLGIREDEDWILNSFYSDFSRMREKIAYGLWKDITNLEKRPVHSSSVTYVEVIWNQEYRGLYGLMPRLDAKQMAMGDGLIYKMRTWGYADDAAFQAAAGTDSLYDENSLLAATLEYPNGSGSWAPLQAYYQYVMGDDAAMMEELDLSVNVSNAVAHSLYCTLLQAADNTWKNIYLGFYSDPEGGYTIFQAPWDMDMTFGIIYEGTDEDLVTPRSLSNESMVYRKLHRDDAQQAEALAKEKWKLWRRSGISADRLCSQIDRELDYLTRTGVLLRDAQRWNFVDHAYLAELLKGWIRAQFDQMDAQFGK